MCLAPYTLKDRTQVACGGCRVCRDNRVNDMIGRCIAEGISRPAKLAVTLTYAGDVPESALLRYKDVQLMIKRLRKAGYDVRYIVAGEYGSKKGRAHWHGVLFFKGKLPEHSLDTQKYMWPYWPHGFSFFQQPDYGGFKYVLKYALKDQSDQGATKALSMSKKPPLGFEYFMERAVSMAQQRFAMHSPEYSFSDVLMKNGAPRKFWLQGRMRELYFDRFIKAWQELHGRMPPVTEWWQEQVLDKIAAREADLDPALVVEEIARKRVNFYATRRKGDTLRRVGHSTDGIIPYSGREATILHRGEEWHVKGNIEYPLAVQLERLGLAPMDVARYVNHCERQWWLLSNPDTRGPQPAFSPLPFVMPPSPQGDHTPQFGLPSL